MKQYFSGKNYSVPGKTTIVTSEGVAAVDDAITALKAQSSLAALKWDQYLGQAAIYMADA